MTTEEYPIPRKLWEHPDPESTQMWKFKTSLEKTTGRAFPVRVRGRWPSDSSCTG